MANAENRIWGIHTQDEKLFLNNSIIAKYYRYGSLDLTKKDGLPETDSVKKQFLYSNYIKEKFGADKVYNAFIIPYNKNGKNKGLAGGKTLFCPCYAKSDDTNETKDVIFVFLIDLYYLVHNWYKGTGAEMQNKLVNSIAESKD